MKTKMVRYAASGYSPTKEALETLLMSIPEYRAQTPAAGEVLNKTLLNDLARRYDKGLLDALYGNETLRSHFFTVLSPSPSPRAVGEAISSHTEIASQAPQAGTIAMTDAADIASQAPQAGTIAMTNSRPCHEAGGGDVSGSLVVFKLDVFLSFINSYEFLPDSYTKYKQKIGLGFDAGYYLKQLGDVVLNFPYKDCVLKGGQTKDDEKRAEVFYNTVLAPDEVNRLLDDKVFTSWTRYTKDGEVPVGHLSPNDNLIIKGNNLVVLHSLMRRYGGKVKLIYIDPPYNTGSDSFGYNDNFSHSSWLVFMKNRLEAARQLLRGDGCIFVQCDDNEQAYLKVLMDEVMGRENFITTVTCKVKAPSGVASNANAFFDCAEYILCYAKGDFDFTPYKIDSYVVDASATKITSAYNQVIDYVNYDAMHLVGNVDEIEIYKVDDYKIRTASSKERTQEFYYNNWENIFRLAALSGGKEKKIYKFLLQQDDPDALYCYRYTPSKGKNAGVLLNQLVYKKNSVCYLKDFSYKDDKRNAVVKQDIITNIITSDLWQGIASEGGVEMKNGKKPEKLLQIFLSIFTRPGDIVLDYHIGSGTTAAVAHKMGRQYIGVEQMDYIKSVTVERLKKVIAGEQGGVSKQAGWTGGGSFVYCEVASDAARYIERINKAEGAELDAIKDEMAAASCLNWRVEKKGLRWPSAVREVLPGSPSSEAYRGAKPLLSAQEKRQLLADCLDPNDLYVHMSEAEDEAYGISCEDKRLTKEMLSYLPARAL